eukprot:4437117-Pyramimonas_sp.AAC.2
MVATSPGTTCSDHTERQTLRKANTPPVPPARLCKLARGVAPRLFGRYIRNGLERYIRNGLERCCLHQEENVLLVFFEDLKEDLESSVQRIAQFMGISLLPSHSSHHSYSDAGSSPTSPHILSRQLPCVRVGRIR